jgi:hypothetical protein
MESSCLDSLITGSGERESRLDDWAFYLFHCFPLRKDFAAEKVAWFDPRYFGFSQIRISSDSCAWQLFEHLTKIVGSKFQDIVGILESNWGSRRSQVLAGQLLDKLFHVAVHRGSMVRMDRRKFGLCIASELTLPKHRESGQRAAGEALDALGRTI